jgi:hypothetical protein
MILSLNLINADMMISFIDYLDVTRIWLIGSLARRLRVSVRGFIPLAPLCQDFESTPKTFLKLSAFDSYCRSMMMFILCTVDVKLAIKNLL